MLSKSEAFSSFSVDDLAAAKNFYKETLGLNVSTEPEGLKIELAEGGNIFVYPKLDHQPATFTILNFMVNNVEAAVDDLTAKGVHIEKFKGEIATDEKGIFRGQGPTIAWFKDPAGNFLSVIESE